MRRPQTTNRQAWDELNARIIACERCPRLRSHCQKMAAVKRRAFADWEYWGKPVSNFGDADARLLIVGLAPAAHGANRTGRMFTGDRSGDFLYAAMHAAGFASQAEATHRDDGLRLHSAVITAAAHCAPPGNKPDKGELDACFEYLVETATQLPKLKVCLALGGIALQSCVRLYRTMGWSECRPAPRFSHGMCFEQSGAPVLMACYHPSQQNTFTGRLTMEMLIDVFRRAAAFVER